MIAALRWLADDLHTHRAAVDASSDFAAGVGEVTLRLLERGDPEGLVLRELFRDLEARLGELVIDEEDT